MARQRGVVLWDKWRELAAAQEGSGQTVAAFCRERGISRPQFFCWKRRLREAADGGFIELKAAVVAAAPIELRLRNGRSLWLRPGFDAGLLRQVLAALEEAS